jgi:NTP pyrophosphatase (non-canonical NTP hydrolase)
MRQTVCLARKQHSHDSAAAAMVCELHQAYGHPEPGMPMWALRSLRAKLILEECAEAADAIMGRENWKGNTLEPPPNGPTDRAHVLKELADILVVTYGAADVLGLPLDTAFMRVHISNMSKVELDGTVRRREDGKILKGPRYLPPNLDDLV